MSTLAARSAEEAVALDREALALLDTKLRALFVERERMAEASQHDQALDLAFLRVPMSPGPRGPQVAAPLVTSSRNDFRAWVQVLLETLKR